jgi:hypothetical protein
MSELLFTEVSADQQELVTGGVRGFASTGRSGDKNSNFQNYSVNQKNKNGNNTSTINSETLIYSYQFDIALLF